MWFTDGNNYGDDAQKAMKDKKAGKRTRWGSDQDRVPYEQMMLLQQSATKYGLQMPHAGMNLQEQMQYPPPVPVVMDFYNEITSNANDNKDSKDSEKDNSKELIINSMKDLDLRQLLPIAAKRPHVVSIADEVASLTKKAKLEEESDRDEESSLIIEMPTEDDDQDKDTSHGDGNEFFDRMLDR